MPLYDIYVFKSCSRDSCASRFYLYPEKRCDNVDDNFLYIKQRVSCSFLYRLENETLEFHEKIEMVKETEIDGQVIYWMSKEGIDHVRGGSFADQVLSNFTKEYISKQIKFMNYDLEKNAELVDRLHSMKNAGATFSLLDTLQIKVKIDKYKITQEKIAKYYPVVSIEDLNWLRSKIDTCLNGEWHFLEITAQYDKLIEKMKTLYKQYMEYHYCEEQNMPSVSSAHYVYLNNPHFYFDSRVIANEKMNSKVQNDDEMFKTYELMIYTLINRTDELKFEIHDFDIEWEEFYYNYCINNLLSR